MTTVPAARKAGAIQGFSLLLPLTLGVMAIVALVPVMPKIIQEYAAVPNAAVLVQLMLVLPSLFLVLFSPVAGWLGDRFGRRPLLIWSMLVYVGLGVLPMVLTDLRAILVSRALVGCTEAAVITLSTTLIGDYYKGSDRDKWLGYQTAVASVAAVVLFALSGFLGHYGWRAVFLIYALPLPMALLIWKVTWEPEASEAEEPHPIAGAHAFPWKRMTGVCVVTLFGSVMFYVLQLQGGIALASIGLTASAVIGMLTAFTSVGTIAGTIIFRYITRWRTAVLLALGFLLAAAGLWGMALARDAQLMTAALFVGQIGCGFLLPTLITWAVRGLAYEVRGRGVGLAQGVFAFGQFVSGLMFGVLMKQMGEAQGAFHLLAMINLAAGAVCAIVFVVARQGLLREDE
jgi:MFS family permease